MARKGRLNRGLLSKKDAAGKTVWYVRLWHESQERRFGSFNTKTKARDFYEKAKQEQKAGRFFPERYRHKGHIKLKDFIRDYMATNTNKSINDDWCHAHFWIDYFQSLNLRGITSKAIDQAKLKLLAKGLSNQTVVHYLKLLRHVLNLAIRDGELEANPLAKVEFPKLSKGRVRFLSAKEEKVLCEKIGHPYSTWIRLAILTGLRQKEQFSLKWTDVDLEQGFITLPDTKTGETQYAALSQEAKETLQSINSWQHSQWVFPSKNPGTHVDPSNFYFRVYVPAVKAANLQNVTWHTLRHTFASRLAMAGGTERDIASGLRHSSTALVGRYAHLSPTHMKEVMERVSGYGQINGMTQNSSGTVTETGRDENGQKENTMQVVENIGAGEGI